jgi:hypothetical protein
MPPQQAYGLLDFIDKGLDLGAHRQSVPSSCSNFGGPYCLARPM